ncbi:SDR family oxidoreductase [Leptolyngbya sp. NIES-2104]|uniref:SDR family oxidoreductase n=1 Tax=Leptolyngbya sp. NIES-2104 TaxID=1552121 RepID=UPI0006EC6228|nr:SDR family oxidoreductase [Leptolyngbya sp. NIES-2104]GAP96188.1 3-oxoacyl-[acyl-carrier protein] reductase [Leptolyngbya sp. NIES-2104]
MTKTVLITGASTGIGRSTALLFAQKGWNVIATMRSPEKADWITGTIHPLKLDVTDSESIKSAIAQSLSQFGSNAERGAGIDVLVNNAGYALVGAFENCSSEQIRKQFDTNVFGLMEVTKALLPHFRERRSGVIINIASIGGRISFPTYTVYNSTKWAVEGFSEGLQYELEPFNIRVKIIEPGPIKTDFYDRSPDVAKSEITAYDEFVNRVLASLNRAGERGEPAEVVAQTIYKAAIDNSNQLRYSCDRLGGVFLTLRKVLPDNVFSTIIRSGTTR